MRDPKAHRIDFLVRHAGLTEQQATDQVNAEQDQQVAGTPAAERILITFHPFHSRPEAVAESIGHRPAAWEATWTAATEAGEPGMSDVLGIFESQADSPQEAIDWARSRCSNVWIRPDREGEAVTVEEYLGRA
jgi:hypothetical protein